MYCYKCGKEIKDDSIFCYSCGSKVEIKEEQVPISDTLKNNKQEMVINNRFEKDLLSNVNSSQNESNEIVNKETKVSELASEDKIRDYKREYILQNKKEGESLCEWLDEKESIFERNKPISSKSDEKGEKVINIKKKYLKKRNISIAVIVAIIGIFLLITNPSKDDFVEYLTIEAKARMNKEKIVKGEDSSFWNGIILLFGRMMLNEVGKYKNFFFFSTFTIDLSTFSDFGSDLKNIELLGIGKMFIPLSGMKIDDKKSIQSTKSPSNISSNNSSSLTTVPSSTPTKDSHKIYTPCIQTVGGKFCAEKANNLDSYTKILTLSGKSIQGIESPMELSIVGGPYRIGDNDVVAVDNSTGGNCSDCGIFSVMFILVKPDGTYTISESIIESIMLDPSMSECKSDQEGNKVFIKCGKYITLTYEDGKVTKSTREMTETEKIVSRNETCEYLYDAYETCGKTNEVPGLVGSKKVCSHEGFDHIHSSWYELAVSDKSYKMKLFDSLCKKSCQSPKEKSLRYDEFQSKVCGK